MALEHLRRQTFEWEGAGRDGAPLHVSGVVRERVAVDKFRRVAFKALLPVEAADSFVDSFVRGQFTDFVMLTENVVGLPWWVGVHASPEQLAQAFEQWQVLPGDLVDVWYNALEDVSQPPEPSQNGASEPVTESAGEDADPNA